jgi:hypothetical protein
MNRATTRRESRDDDIRVPPSESTPLVPRRFVPFGVVIRVVTSGAASDAVAFREDVDGLVDQDPTPRA